MSQLFHPSANTIARVTIFGALIFVTILAGVGLAIARSPIKRRSMLYSHSRYNLATSTTSMVSVLIVDATLAEESSFAGLPPTHTCT
ncbi:MAG: hypothetical protein R2932_30515 [Caldilineaceae bacterium]